MMRVPAVAALLLLAACHAQGEAPKVTRAWVRLPASPGGAAAGYFTLEGGSKPRRLIKAASALAARVELHESMASGKMMEMRPVAAVELPAGGEVRFAPGGKHLMLFGLSRLVQPGTAVPIRLGFADGTTAEGEAKTVAVGEGEPY